MAAGVPVSVRQLVLADVHVAAHVSKPRDRVSFAVPGQLQTQFMSLWLSL